MSWNRLDQIRQESNKGLLCNLYLVGYDDTIPVYAVESTDRVIGDHDVDLIFDYLTNKHGEHPLFNLEVFS